MSTDWRFPVLALVSFVAFLGVLRAALAGRRARPSFSTLCWVAAIVVLGGMLFARAGARGGLPVWLYYGVPAALTWALPPIVFRMRVGEIARYLPLALLVAPLIHVVFAFFFGWTEYLPFIAVPSLRDLVGWQSVGPVPASGALHLPGDLQLASASSPLSLGSLAGELRRQPATHLHPTGDPAA